MLHSADYWLVILSLIPAVRIMYILASWHDFNDFYTTLYNSHEETEIRIRRQRRGVSRLSLKSPHFSIIEELLDTYQVSQ